MMATTKGHGIGEGIGFEGIMDGFKGSVGGLPRDLGNSFGKDSMMLADVGMVLVMVSPVVCE